MSQNRVVIAFVKGSVAKPYNVSFVFDDGTLQCGCPAWTRHTPRRDCKHIDAAFEKAAEGLSRPAVTLLHDDFLAGQVLEQLPKATVTMENGQRKITL